MRPGPAPTRLQLVPVSEQLCQALGSPQRCGPGWLPHGSSWFLVPLCRALGSSQRCGPGWLPHGSSCFSFSPDALSWGRALNACADLGAHLAVIKEQEEQLFLLEHSNRSSSYWLGLRDLQRAGAMALAHGRGAHRDVLGRVAAGGAAGARGLRGPGAQGALGEREVLGAAALVCQRPNRC
uniref:C-type lectin domain family 4 member E-like n=1 Tax=Agelaius phoeniceus TaxID=39638 RepID=UPI0023ECE90D|nr:C-type lectin domain family 4 member E-like [Agelaius phoeniceus]